MNKEKSIEVLNKLIEINNDRISAEKKYAILKLDSKIKNVHHTYHSIDKENIVEGINDFVHLHQSRLVIMLPKKHNILDCVLQKNEAKKSAFHTNIPLIAIH